MTANNYGLSTSQSAQSLTSDDAKLSCALAGDGLSLKTLLLDHSSSLLSSITAQIPVQFRSRIPPEDILQQVYIRALRGIGSFTADSDHPLPSFRKWLETIAQRLILDELRRKSTKEQSIGVLHTPPTIGESGPGGGLGDNVVDSQAKPVEDAIRNDLRRIIHATIGYLPATYQQVVQLHYLEGYTLAEVSQRMGISEGQVRNFDRQAKKKMREILVRFSLYL